MKSENSKAHSDMREAIQRIAVGPDRGRDISRSAAASIIQAVLAGHIDEIQTAVFLIALRMKRESMIEFQGLFDGLGASCNTVTADVDELVCLADPFDGYVRTSTMTPFIAPVLAACGMTVLMHGVESVGPKHGITAHKVYALAGMDCHQSVDAAAMRLANDGCSYLDQSTYAADLYALGDLRDRIVKRTALTTLERLLMPVKGLQRTHLILGYVHRAYPEIYAKVAEQAGYDSILLLKGVEGGLAPALNKPLRRFFFNRPLPQTLDSEKELIQLENLALAKTAAAAPIENQSSRVEECLEAGLSVLNGRPGLARDSLCLAAAVIVFTHNKSLSLAQAVEKVQFCLDNGSARVRFDAMISNR